VAAGCPRRAISEFFPSFGRKLRCKLEILKVPEKIKRGTLTVAWLQKLENIAKEGVCKKKLQMCQGRQAQFNMCNTVQG